MSEGQTPSSLDLSSLVGPTIDDELKAEIAAAMTRGDGGPVSAEEIDVVASKDRHGYTTGLNITVRGGQERDNPKCFLPTSLLRGDRDTDSTPTCPNTGCWSICTCAGLSGNYDEPLSSSLMIGDHNADCVATNRQCEHGCAQATTPRYWAVWVALNSLGVPLDPTDWAAPTTVQEMYAPTVWSHVLIPLGGPAPGWTSETNSHRYHQVVIVPRPVTPEQAWHWWQSWDKAGLDVS